MVIKQGDREKGAGMAFTVLISLLAWQMYLKRKFRA